MADWVHTRARGWQVRGSFALLLLAFSEFGVWETPGTFGALRWAAVAAIYLALAAIALDLIARLKINEILSLFLVAGMYGLLNGMLVSHVATSDLPMSLIGRPLGAHPLAFMLALAAYRILGSGRATGPLDFAVAVIAGLAWGIWVRWLPVVANEPIPAVAAGDAVTVLAVALIGAALVRFSLTADTPRVPEDWLLQPLEWGAMGGVLVIALIAGISDGSIAASGWGIVIVLQVYIFMLLYVTQHLRGADSYLRAVTPPRLPNIAAWLVLVIPALVAGWIGYHLPGNSDGSVQGDILFGALLGIGLVWLPGVSAVLGMRAVVRLAREGL